MLCSLFLWETDMKLDNRLQAVADLVPLSISVADIGTDHGYLALHLHEKNRERTVIAADLNAGPCDAARKTFIEAGVEEEITVRQGNGLEALKLGEVDCVCIAGMGGKLISDILNNSPDIFSKLKYVILQPQNGAMNLRKWILANHWSIEAETLAKADGRIYQVMRAVPGADGTEYSEIELLAGPRLLKNGHELLHEYAEHLADGLYKIVEGLQKAHELSLEQAVKLQKTRELIEELKKL